MNPVICPSILAGDEATYRKQIEQVGGFAHRIQIDLTDGKFAPHKTIAPEQIWWPVGIKADIHLMFDDPKIAASQIVAHKPNLVIVHAESQANPAELAHLCSEAGVALGVAVLPDTPVNDLEKWLDLVKHVLVFSGQLGQYGGHADLSLLAKVNELKQLKPELEIGWDGGINDQNIATLVAGGVDVLDVGGFIQNSGDPGRTFEALQRIADETGTT